MPMLSIEQHIDRHAQNAPERVAMALNGEKLTYAELSQRTMLRAQHYQGMQRKGVVLRARCDADFLISYFAVHGLWPCFCLPSPRPNKLRGWRKSCKGFAFQRVRPMYFSLLAPRARPKVWLLAREP